MSDYSDHQVGVRCGGALTAVSCHCHHFMTHPAGLGWAAISIFSIPCPVSASTVYTLQWTKSWRRWGIIFILILRDVSNWSQSLSLVLMQSCIKKLPIWERKRPQIHSHIGTVDRYLKSDIRYRNGWRGRFSTIRWISIRAGNKHREVTSFTITEKAFSWLKAHTSMLFTSSSSIQQEKAIVKL